MSDRIEATVRRARRALERAAEEFPLGVRERAEGTVLSIADGVLRIGGLPGAAAEEVLQIGDHGRALVLSLGPDHVEAIALGDTSRIHEGARVRLTGAAASIDVGEGVIGRVLDPLGRPLDGGLLTGVRTAMPLECEAPAIFERGAVHRPLLTGCLAVDAMFAIGRGQRELILGEEGTGKTSLALDIALRQRDTDVIVVWVGIGRRRSETWHIVEELRRGGGRFVVVTAFEDMSPGLRTLTPFAGTAIAEYFARRGEHALVIYDDLIAHAVAWREVSLLLRRPPGREAFPGDVFYLHARLLERSAQLSPEMGGGSITALPIAGLEGGRISSYIPTNLISITDGQLVLSRSLFAAGQKPAIDAGLSVSRVGAKAQPQALKELAGRMRLDYASFLELESFSRLGTHLEASTERRIALGRRLRALLRAPRLAPLSLAAEVVLLLFASDKDTLQALPEDRVAALGHEAIAHCARTAAGAMDRIDRTGVLQDADRDVLLKELADFLRRRAATTTASPTPAASTTPVAEALGG